jgi:hypothetical protein
MAVNYGRKIKGKKGYRQSKLTTYDAVQENENWKEFPMRKSGE